MSEGPKILAVDEDRALQVAAATVFNQANLFYRFVTDRKKAVGGIKQLKPDLLILRGDVSSDLVTFVLEQLAADVSLATVPIALLCDDVSDAAFVAGLRSGVVAMFQLPFIPSKHIPQVKTLLEEMPLRHGVVTGNGNSAVLAKLVEHVRRTRRSGVITFDARTPREGTATFALGKLESARFKTLSGVEALVAMVAQPQAQWRFAEVGGASGDGAGVVIEVGDSQGDEEEVAVVQGVALEDEQPLQAFEMAIEKPPVPAVAPAPVKSSRANPIRLLLVDDDEALCRMFSTLFTKHGFQVTTAADGIDGFETATRGEFDSIIADLNMPRMDGWGMLRMLRDDYRTRELPIAFLSCHDDYREQLRAQNAGAQGYFAKGTRLDPLVSQVRKLIEPREQALLKIRSKEDFSVSVAAVGPQWLLREMALASCTGKLTAKDGWAQYELFMTEGKVMHAAAVAGRFTAEAERAFNAFLASRAAEATFRAGTFPSPTSLALPTEVMIEQGCGTLNENERRIREGLLVSAGQIEVNDALYAVYTQVGPKQWLEVARLICEERIPPREIIASMGSPIEVEETLKDLVRRGVVTLKKA
jgi:DNA-binding response OmpR family regulator